MKKIKLISFIVICMFLTQILLNILIPIKVNANVYIRIDDRNFYNVLVEQLGDKIESKDDTNRVIYITPSNNSSNSENKTIDSTNGNSKVDNTLSNNVLPKAGSRAAIVIAIVLILLFGLIQLIKYRKYKDIK